MRKVQMAGKGFQSTVRVMVEEIAHNPGAVDIVAAVHVGHIRGGGVVAHKLGKQDGDKAGGNPVGVLVGSGKLDINIQNVVSDSGVVAGVEKQVTEHFPAVGVAEQEA